MSASLSRTKYVKHNDLQLNNSNKVPGLILALIDPKICCHQKCGVNIHYRLNLKLILTSKLVYTCISV